jgi:Outer membrane protein beta-barrel domain
MRSSLVALATALVVSLLLPQTASAKPTAGKKLSLGADLLFVAPVGDLADLSGPLIGPVVRGGYLVKPGFEVNGRIGYLFGSKKDQFFGLFDSRISDLPVWLGARYFFRDTPVGPYAGAELGLNVMRGSLGLSGTGLSASSSFTRLGANLQAGYVISPDVPIDLRLQVHYLNLLGGDDRRALLGVGVSAGYTAFF